MLKVKQCLSVIIMLMVICFISGCSTSEINSVKIKSIDVQNKIVKNKLNKFGLKSEEEVSPQIKLDNYVILDKSGEFTFTISLDNPEAYAIDALRIQCDDPTAMIYIDGEYKPIAYESDGTRVVNWSSEDPYVKSYKIKLNFNGTLSLFKVVDLRLAGHEKFQSKELNTTDLGNNEFYIYQINGFAYSLNVLDYTFDYAKFNITINEKYKNIISNVKVNGEYADETTGCWTIDESQIVDITYDFYLEKHDITVKINDSSSVKKLEFKCYSHPYCGLPMYINPYGEDLYFIDLCFNLNTNYNVYYKGVALKLITKESGYNGYFEYPNKPDPDSYYVYNRYSLPNPEEVLPYFDIGSGQLNFPTKEELDEFIKSFTITTSKGNYKFDYLVSEGERDSGKFYTIDLFLGLIPCGNDIN